MGQLRTANKRHNRTMLHRRSDHAPVASTTPAAPAPQDAATPVDQA